MIINCKKAYNEESLKELCDALESGQEVQIFIDCVGHITDYSESAHYASELYSLYGDRLVRTLNDTFYHSYKLKDVGNNGD